MWSARISILRRLAWLHGHNHFDFTRLSLDSLWLGSPLVVRGTIGGVRSRYADGGRYRNVRTITISSVLRQAGTAFVPGQSVLLSEPIAFQDVPYSDDPPLRDGSSAVFFLTPARHRVFNRLAGIPLFEQTAPTVSTWVDGPGGIRPVSAMRTRVAFELRSSLARRSVVADGLRRAEASRQLRVGQNEALLRSNPHEALRKAYLYDLTHQR